MESVAPIVIDEEFRNLCHIQTDDELLRLRDNIERDGCLDSLKIWKENGILLDGHTRKRICDEIGARYSIEELSFETREDALIWVCDFQDGRRNSTPEQKSYRRGKRYEYEKKKSGGRSDRTFGEETVSPPKTAEKLGAEYGVSDRTIKNDAAFAKAVDAIADSVGEDARNEILSGQSELPRKDIVAIAAGKPEEVRSAYEKATKAVHVSQNTGMPEWYTPPEYLDAARNVLGGFDTDPASSEIAQKRVQAKTFYTVDDDGLSKRWSGRVWMNPPYTAGLVDKFLSKLLSHLELSEVTDAIVLVNNATDTKWFQGACGAASCVCFPSGRIKFLDPEGNPGAPLQGQAIIYFGSDAESFCREFASFGFCARIER